MRFPASLTLMPQENQFTEVLAWLVDRSDVFARLLVELFLQHDDDEGRAAVRRAKVIGARTQVSLPKLPGTGVLRPDLSVAGSEKSFQLLVEVKIGSDPHSYELEGIPLVQPDAYIAAWRQCLPELEAPVRRVGTLTRGFEFAPADDEMRARDAQWHEISELLAVARAECTLEPEVRQVAHDYQEVISERILGMDDLPPPEEVAALLAWGRKVLPSFVKELASRIQVKPGTTTQKKDFCAQTFRVTSPSEESTQLWIAIMPRGARYNSFAMQDSVHLRIEDPQKPDPLRVHAGGFEFGQDLVGYTFFGRSLSLVELPYDDVAHTGALLADWVADSLKACDPPLA